MQKCENVCKYVRRQVLSTKVKAGATEQSSREVGWLMDESAAGGWMVGG